MKGLEALKYLKEEKRRHWIDGDKSTECLDTIEKELKALEIIKNKTNSACNCLMILKSRFDDLSYEDYTKLFITELAKEEYDLLKEILK